MHELISPDSAIDPLVANQSGVWCKRTDVSHLVVKLHSMYRCRLVRLTPYACSPAIDGSVLTVFNFMRRRWRATFFDKQIYNSFFLNRLIVSLLHVFLGILSPRIWHNDHREVNERMKEVLMMEWL